MSKPTTIARTQAAAEIGQPNMNRAAQAPGRATGFGLATKRDFKKHPEKYAAAGYAIYELIANPPKGFRDAIDVIVAGAFAVSDAIRNAGDD